MQRVVPEIGALFDGVEDSIHGGFFSPLLGSAISKDLRDLTTTPIKLGGFSLPNPTLTSETNFTASQCETAHLINALHDLCIFSHVKHKQVMETCWEAMKAEKGLAASALIDQISHRQGGHASACCRTIGRRGAARGWQQCRPWTCAPPSAP